MFTAIDQENRISTSDIELVYGMDGSTYPTTVASPVLTLRGDVAVLGTRHRLLHTGLPPREAALFQQVP